MKKEEESKIIKSEAALREERILGFWRENNIFQKSLEKESPKGEFVFYEGPPGVNGVPMLHHFEARAFKDVIPRYKTMQGYHVDRRAGWDCHGLPVELQAEKELGITSKKEIETFGIAKYNAYCRKTVDRYAHEWDIFTERMGYWIDNKRAYYTMDNTFIESSWNIISEASRRGYLYKDYKILPWCARCGTGLSSHELGQPGVYVDVKDLSVTAKFKVVGEDNTFLLAWTTTPWTLAGNVGLAVGKDIEYTKLKVPEYTNVSSALMKENQQVEKTSILSGTYIIAKKNLLKPTFVELLINSEINNYDDYTEGKITEDEFLASLVTIKGSDLVGLEYEPLYPYLSELDKGDEKLQNAFKIYPADFVTTEDGTGIVHTAVMYGQEDFELGTKVGLPKFHTVDETGHFIKGTEFLEGRFVKDEDVAVDIIKDLAHRGLLFKKEKYEHPYPHCWRCKTPLVYYARDSWYFAMSKLREELVNRNETINWEPAHIKEGRFGEWLREAKDWAISRERYWGTPLPVWQTEDGKRVVMSSIDELKKNTKKSGNTYFVMRHGEAEHNLGGFISDAKDAPDHLTEKGKEQVRQSAEAIKNKKIDLIVASPFIRTEETTEIVREVLGLPKESVITDDRLHEFVVGNKKFKTWKDYHSALPKTKENFSYAYEGGESYMNIKKRVMDLMYKLEQKYAGKNILLVTHGGPSWLLVAGILGYQPDKCIDMIIDRTDFHFLENAEIQELPFTPLPHNENYELDLHRPYIDEISYVDENGDEMTRVKEVMDVWFDSGAMPLAQDHYPFENKEWIEKTGYPADFISEAIDQTRGWFYTLLAISALVDKPAPFRNAICLGHLLDAKGQKMSKSKGNVIDAWEQMEKFGADTVRLWMYAVTQPGDSKNYDEKVVHEFQSKIFGLLYNILSFYELYRDKEAEILTLDVERKNILDQWIIARFNQMTNVVTDSLDSYKLLEPVREIRDFIGDLSTWYLRRSRERIKEGDRDAKQTLYYILMRTALILAPFAPFTAEDIYQRLKHEDDLESVHLFAWLSKKEIDQKILDNMEEVRKIVTFGLEARQKKGIKVRQPLGQLKVKSLSLQKEYIELMKEELNVKEIIEDSSIEEEVELDTNITPELKKEGGYRELVRAIQDMRKKMNLNPNDMVNLGISTDGEGKKLVETFENELKKVAGLKGVAYETNDGEEVKIGDMTFKLKLF